MYKHSKIPRAAVVGCSVFPPRGRTPHIGASIGWAECINSQPISDGKVIALPCVWKMPRSQHVKDPFASDRNKRSVGDQFLRLKFLPLHKHT